MRLKLDIADVETRTKIRAKYLRALENEEFGVLPGPSTVRSFLRTYSEVLGLDPHLLVEEYRARHEVQADEVDLQPIAPSAPPTERPPRRERRPPRGGGGSPGPLAILLGGLGALLVFLLVLGLVGGGDEKSSNENAGVPTATRTETTPTTERRAPPRRRRRARRRPTVASVGIEPTVPTYACVDTGPGTDVVFEGILDEPRRFRGKRVRINLGKSSVKLTANGRPLKLDPTPNPIGLEVTPRGTKDLAEGQRPCA